MTIEIMKALDAVEARLTKMSEKADGEARTIGQTSTDTKAALEAIGTTQRELADRLVGLEQKGSAQRDAPAEDESVGAQFTKAAKYGDFASGSLSKMRVETKGTVLTSNGQMQAVRQGMVGGAFLPFALEALLPSTATAANSIDFVRENVFTNGAAEVAEGALKGTSDVTFSLVAMPITTVAHWIKISKQLAADAPALTAYINTRMIYGVNKRVDDQLVVGNGIAPNLQGILLTGNFTAHGYANAALGTVLKKLVLIRKVMADLMVAGYPADSILLNPADWAQIEIELFTTVAGQTLYSVDAAGNPRLFGLPVVQAISMTAGTFLVGQFGAAYMVYNREGVVVEMSDSDSDNFTKNLITLRAERRLGLACERPAAIRGGLLAPA
jgi:HK97 family phage major capsid protein